MVRVSSKLHAGFTAFIAPSSHFNLIHTSGIYSTDISSIGKLAVSSSTEGSLIVWRIKDGKVLENLAGHVLDVNRCRFFPSGLVVLSAGILLFIVLGK